MYSSGAAFVSGDLCASTIVIVRQPQRALPDTVSHDPRDELRSREQKAEARPLRVRQLVSNPLRALRQSAVARIP